MKPLTGNGSLASSSATKCFLAAFFGILQLYVFHLLAAFTAIPAAYAMPLPENVRERANEDSSASSSPQGSPTTTATSSSPSANNGPDPGSNSLTNNDLALMLGVIAAIILAIILAVFLRKWWRKRQSRRRSEKEDREPLSASFQPGELPALPYWPESGVRSPGLA